MITRLWYPGRKFTNAQTGSSRGGCALTGRPRKATRQSRSSHKLGTTQESSRGESATATLALSHCLATESRQVKITQHKTGKDLSTGM